MTLWFVFALMTVAAIFAVLWPLSRGGRPQSEGSEAAVYKDQLAEIDRDDRHADQRYDRRGAAQRGVRRHRRIALLIRCGQQTAADLDAGSVRFGSADQRRGNIAIDLGELILVDGRLVTIVWRPGTAAQRPEHGEDRRGRHQREHKPQRHQAGSGEAAPHGRADAPLYTTGGKPGN